MKIKHTLHATLLHTVGLLLLAAGISSGRGASPLLSMLNEPLRVQRQTPLWFSRYDVEREPKLIFEFSGPVDVERARAKACFIDDAGRRVGAEVDHPEAGDFPQGVDPLRARDEGNEGDPVYPRANALVVTPLEPLPVGENWKMVIESGVSSPDGGAGASEEISVVVGTITHLALSRCLLRSSYDSQRGLEILFNKDLSEGLSVLDLESWLEIHPAPAGMELRREGRRIRIDGEFTDGIVYRLAIKAGFPARDGTALQATARFERRFKPEPPYLSLAVENATRRLSASADLEIRGGNLESVRVRAKLVEPGNHLYAMRAYELYLDSQFAEDERPLKIVPYDAVPGKTIYRETLEPKAALSTSGELAVAWENILARNESGLIFIDVEGVPRGEVGAGRKRLVAQSLIQATDLAMAIKAGASSGMVFVFSQESGKPLGGTELRLYNRDLDLLEETRTGEDGLARIEASEGGYWIVADTGSDHLTTRFDRSANSLSLWRYGIPVDTSRDDDATRRTLMFTDRPLYRPGETLHLKAITRIIEGDLMRFPADGKARLTMVGPRGRTILDRDVTFGSSGALDQEIDLPGENPGDYRLKLDFADSSEGNSSYWNRNVYHHFRVDDYALNTFEVDLETKEFDPFGGEIPISLSARYLMGKPLSSAKYSWSATVMPREFSAPGFGSFHFGRRSEREHHSYHGRGELSGEGKAEITLLTASGEGGPGPRSVYFNTEVTDINQQTISRSTSVKIDGSDYYLGVRRPGSARVDGDPIRIEAVAVTAAGGRYRGETPVRCLIERKEFNAVRMKTASGEMVTRSEALWVPVKEVQSVLTAGHDDTGTLLALLEPDSAGWYAVTLHSTDGGGRPVETRMEFHVGGAGERSFARREGVRIDLQPDKEAYAPGETAMVSIESPIAGTALITVERSRVSRSYLREVGRNGTIVEIPIEKGDGPNVFISALVVRGAVDSPRKFREPEFKLGYCELRVEDQTNVLDVELAPSQPSYQPGEKVAIEGRVRDRAGSPVTGAEVTLFAVDEGVLSLMGFEVPDPFRTFHAPFALAVRSAITLTGMMSENPDEQTFENKGRLIGGGGEEALWQGNQRDDFRACAYWGASERTDGEGRIRVEFEAPDSLTRYRIIAVVSAGAERFGRAESAFEINQPLMIEPALARFGNAGDRVQAKGIVFNTSDYSGEFRVTLSLDPTSRFDGDAELEGDAAGAASMKRSRLITLAAGETGAVVFPVRFVEPGSAQWTWEVQPAPAGGSDPLAANLSDRRLSKLEIGHPMPLLKESYFTRLQPGESWDDVLARVDTELRRGKGVVTVSISRSRMLEAADALEYILRYPYGCVEQTTSSLLPWVRLRGLRRELPGLKKTDEEILAAIQGGADRLLGMQTGSGGLGYWPGSSHPMLWGSAYGGLGLTLAKESGAEVPEASLSSLYDYLADALRNVSQEKEHERMIELCLGAYTLAVAGRAEHAYHELLFNQRSRLSSEARYLVAMAILESGGDRAMARTLLTDAGAELGGWRYWHGPSHRRSLELIAWSMLEPGGEAADEIATALLKLRGREGHWGSTHTSGWAVLALAEHAESVPRGRGALAADLDWGATSASLQPVEGRGDASIAIALDDGNRDAPLRLRATGGSPMMVNLRIEARPEEIPADAIDHGFKISRSFREIRQDGGLSPADDLEIGDLVMVELEIEAPGPARYMVIDDPLPCLFEAINPNFSSQQARAKGQRKWKSWHSDYRETRTDRVVFFRNWLPRGGRYRLQYLARVISEGEALAPAAKIEEMYHPERFGLSAPRRFVIPARPAPVQTPRAVATVEN